jgi:hypothetical protein
MDLVGLCTAVTDMLNSSNMKAESSQHFASPKACDAKRPTVESLRHPFPLQRDL